VGGGVAVKYTGLDAGVFDGAGVIATRGVVSTTHKFGFIGLIWVSKLPEIYWLLLLYHEANFWVV
jgi:hypothetical protein